MEFLILTAIKKYIVLFYELLFNLLTGMEFLKNEHSFMEELCKNFGVDNKQYCSNWFFQANENCYDMLYPMERKATLWDMLQEILFDGQNFGLYDPNFLRGLPSTYLSSIDCANLYKNITMDYVINVIPRNNRLLLQSFLMCFVILALISLYIISLLYKLLRKMTCRKVQKVEKVEIETPDSQLENVGTFFNKHTLNTMKYETKQLHIKSQVTAESFCCPHHTNLVLKVSQKVNFVKSIVCGHNETIGRFYNFPELGVENGKRSVYTSTTKVNKVLEYINKFNSRPLQLWIVFDDKEDNDLETVESTPCEANSLEKEVCYKSYPFQSKMPALPKVSQKFIAKLSKSGSAHDLRTKRSASQIGGAQRVARKIPENEKHSKLKQRSSENCIRTTSYSQSCIRKVY